MAAARRLTLTTTHRMVDRVHGHTPGLGPLALPPVATRLADRDQLVLLVADLAYCGPTINLNPSHLAARQPEGGVRALFGNQLDA